VDWTLTRRPRRISGRRRQRSGASGDVRKGDLEPGYRAESNSDDTPSEWLLEPSRRRGPAVVPDDALRDEATDREKVRQGYREIRELT
jgi:hypothetical protein